MKFQPDSQRKKKRGGVRGPKSIKIRNKKEVTTNIPEIQRIINEFYQQLCADKMEKFLEKHNLPRLNQNKIEKYEKTTTSNLN